MENINLNSILKRDAIEAEMMTILKDMEENDTLLMKRCIFIHGDPGIGKTTFVINALKERYDTIYFDGSDARTKTSIENLADNNIGQYNVTKLLNGIKKQIVIIMDDIESMNCGDKGGINALAKLVRPKKTKRQKRQRNVVVLQVEKEREHAKQNVNPLEFHQGELLSGKRVNFIRAMEND